MTLRDDGEGHSVEVIKTSVINERRYRSGNELTPGSATVLVEIRC